MKDWDAITSALAVTLVVVWCIGIFGFHTIDREMCKGRRTLAMWLCIFAWPIAITCAWVAGVYEGVNTYGNDQKPKG